MKKKHLFYIAIPVVVAVIALITHTSDSVESKVLGEQVKSVSVISIGNQSSGATFTTTGVVVSEQEADLKSQSSGQITSVTTHVGDVVSKGQVLATLSNQDIRAQLGQAEAAVQIQKAQLAELERKTSGNSYIGTIEQQQQAVIDNAHSKLLSEGLIAEPSSDSYTVFDGSSPLTPPVISGRYSGPEGTYKVIIRRGSQINDYEIYVFNLETVRDVEISDTAPTPLGTRGLFISFPDPIRDYIDTIWYVTLPNTKSSTYTQNYSAYVLAQESAGVTVQQSLVSEEQLDSQRAQIAQAEANVAVVQAQLSKTIVRAPFSGNVVAVPVSIGEYVSTGQSIVSLINKSGLSIQSFMSSDESKRIQVGDEVVINKKVPGLITHVSSGINTTNGKVEVLITPNDSEDVLVIGEFVDVDIHTTGDSTSNIVSVPLQAVRPRSNGSVVYVINNDGIIREEKVETGSIVGESIEILSNLPADTLIAASARGLLDGMKVNINK